MVVVSSFTLAPNLFITATFLHLYTHIGCIGMINVKNTLFYFYDQRCVDLSVGHFYLPCSG